MNLEGVRRDPNGAKLLLWVRWPKTSTPIPISHVRPAPSNTCGSVIPPEGELARAVEAHRAGDLAQAEILYGRVFLLKPEHPGAHYGLGCLRMEAGELSSAEARFRSTLEQEPHHADALLNLGVVLFRTGALAAAEDALRQALELDPRSVPALHNLGAVMMAQGKDDVALEVRWRAVQADPESTDAWVAFARVFGSVTFAPENVDDELVDVLAACLLRDDLEHQSLASQAVRILGSRPLLGAVLRAAERGDTTALRAELNRGETLAALSAPVLRLLLERTVIPDSGFERLLTALRAHLADSAPDLRHPELLMSLARQCFLNGYLYQHSPAEVARVEAVADAMAGRDIGSDPLDLIRTGIIASYMPLLEWDRSEEVLHWAEAMNPPNAALDGLVVQQIVEPAEEFALRDEIPRLGRVTEQVSREVQDQYEEHPYPRWTSVDRSTPVSPARVMRELFPGIGLERLDALEAPNVLVAGCGTGRHLFIVRNRFADARILGIDLSLSSLAFAWRKCRGSGIDDVALMHGDILSLGDWQEPFDIIESVGVLHHLEEPVRGWRILRDKLKPGGLMKIGLYSELARRQVVEAREFIADRGYEATDGGIRAARPAIVDHFRGREATLQRWPDFYTMEACRDLLFHVQEHRFTLPRIARIIEELGLDFLGFEHASPGAMKRFEEMHADGADPRSLQAWDRVEQANPDLFRGMYQFWLRRPLQAAAVSPIRGRRR